MQMVATLKVAGSNPAGDSKKKANPGGLAFLLIK
jgi:hypothetical protein